MPEQVPKLQMRREEFPLLFAIFLDLVGFGMAFPDVQLRSEEFAAKAGLPLPGLFIGAILASYFVVQLFASPKWGKLSDRAGRKPILLICTALSALSMLIYSFAESLPLILLSRVLAGFAAANVVVAQAYVADTSTEENRSARQGRVSAAILVGLIAGPALGGYLAAQGGNELLGYVAASASTLSFLWILLAVPSRPPTAERQPGKAPVFDLRLLRDVPDLRGVFTYAAAGWFVLACLEGTFGRLIKHNLGFGQEEFGWIFSYESLLGAVVGAMLGIFARRFATITLLRLAYVLQAVGLLLTPLAPSLFVLFVASTFYAVGLGFANPTINSTCSALTPANRQGELFGLLQATRSFGFLLGPILGGLIFDWRPAAPYILAATVAVMVAVFVKVPPEIAKAEVKIE